MFEIDCLGTKSITEPLEEIDKVKLVRYKIKFSQKEDRCQIIPKITNVNPMQKKYFNAAGVKNPMNIETVAERFPGTPVKAVIGGFHFIGLPLPGARGTADRKIRAIGREMLAHPEARYFTGHCTGPRGFRVLKPIMAERLDALASRYMVIDPSAGRTLIRMGLTSKEARLVRNIAKKPMQVREALSISSLYRSLSRKLIFHLHLAFGQRPCCLQAGSLTKDLSLPS